MLATYKKPNGKTIEINENKDSIKLAQSLGWKKQGKEELKASDGELDTLKDRANEFGVYDSINWNIKGKRKLSHIKADLEKAINDSQATDN
jgi:hypothetical protein